MKKWKDCPLLFAVIIIGVLLTIVGVMETKGSEKRGIGAWVKTPALAVFFQNMGNDKALKQQVAKEKDNLNLPVDIEVETQTVAMPIAKPIAKPADTN
jgi:hypothetical protein